VDHLVRLADEWALWRWSVLRGAGLPASLALRFALPELAHAVDEQLDGERAIELTREALLEALRRAPTDGPPGAEALRRARKALRKGNPPAAEDVAGVADAELVAFQSAVERAAAARSDVATRFETVPLEVSRVLRQVAKLPLLREAATWQNRDAVRRALDPLADTPADAVAGFRDRQREDMAANYIHRYCMKNDTIGFFGPVGWARWDDGTDHVIARPGPELLALRGVYFEQWAIDALGEALAKAERIRPWVAPRRLGFVRLDGAIVKSPLNGRHELDPLEQAVLLACDGDTPATELATRFAAGDRPAPAPAAVYAALERLEAKQLVRWSLEGGARWMPEVELRRRLERVGDPAARGAALAQLDELEAARGAVARAAGDAQQLATAIGALEETFTRLTGATASRLSGSTYAGRGLVFEDCRRDFEMTFGARMINDLGPALSLVLTSARWLTAELASVYGRAFRDLFEELARKTGTRRFPFADFWFRAQRLIHGAKDRPLDAAVRTLHARWAEFLAGATGGVCESRSLAPLVAKAFAAEGPGWGSARHHSPDLMIAATSVEAIARGEYFAVLGEVHVAVNTIDARFFVAMHPAPHELTEAMTRDLPEPRVLVTRSTHATRRGAFRTASTLVTPSDYELEAGIEAATLDRERVLPLGDLSIEEVEGELLVRSSDGKVTLPVLDAFAQPLGEAAANALDFAPSAGHASRLTIDRLVVRRETWRFNPSDIAFATASSDLDRYVSARRWARANGLPRCVFLRSPLEVKPIFVDFDSPVGVRIAAKLIRQASEDVGGQRLLTVTEMLPAVEHAWLPDAAGERYTSEIRVVAVDQRAPGTIRAQRAPSTQTTRSSDV
jgi:Lantibiotic dehydratase, N terminus